MGRYVKTMDEIRRLSDKELAEEIEETYRRLFQLRLQQQTRQLQDTSQLQKLRRHLARLKTEQRARELARINR
ncbi:MAG: 50S ribosomal protein L29 [Dehalococcoidia bacterium]|jgi:large subunit ribosomal protein L29|nr:50S ribosomal protein L29 [Dehalococcoidia bacterium]MDW8008238.1 50S ribosomal protein L29 [Chloroflexota bacterium]